MPLYEYKCESCGETFEIIQKFSDTPLEVHEKCGGPVERLISPSALQVQGLRLVRQRLRRTGNGKQPTVERRQEGIQERRVVFHRVNGRQDGDQDFVHHAGQHF